MEQSLIVMISRTEEKTSETNKDVLKDIENLR